MTPPLSISRRRWLKLAGVLAGASALAPWMATPPAQPAGRPLRMGALVPTSELYPQLGASFLAGLQGALRAGGLAPQLDVRLVGRGGLPLDRAARALAEEGAPQVVVAAVTPEMARGLAPLLTAHRLPLLNAYLDANVARTEAEAPFVFELGLPVWQANFAAGQLAAAQIGGRGLLVASLYESGFDSLYAFQLGMQAAGGEVTGPVITHRPPGPPQWTALAEAVRVARPDFVAAALAGPEIPEFLQAFERLGLAGRLPLVGLGLLAMTPAPAVTGAVAGWRRDLSWPANQAFVGAYERATGQPVEVFAALGHTAGQWLAQAAPAIDDWRTQALPALRQATFEAPLGPVTGHGQFASGPLWAHRLGSPLGVGLEPRLAPLTATDPHVAEIRTALKTGWLHAYGCR